MRNHLPLLLASLLLACRSAPSDAERSGITVSAGAPDTRASPTTRVAPPLVRVAQAEQITVAELLGRPDESHQPAPTPDAALMAPDRREAYEARAAKNVLALQPWRREVSLGPSVTVTDLHPRHHRWLLLHHGDKVYHLENPDPTQILVDLDRSDEAGLALVHLTDDRVQRCAPWTGELAAARADSRTYVPICDDHLILRNAVPGRRSTLEWTTDFLRDNVKGAEHVTGLVKRTTHDRFRAQAQLAADDGVHAANGGPAPVRSSRSSAGTLAYAELGIPLDGAPKRVAAGQWTGVAGSPGAWVALTSPGLAALPDDIADHRYFGELPAKEADALVVLVAFDLSVHELGFEIGTDHPRVDWSARAASSQVDRSLPGPDGVGTIEPLARTGQVPPVDLSRLAAAFTGGFKRDHAAFKGGELSTRNGANHYGVIQDGVVLSKLQPGLSTVVVWGDGRVDLVTWSEALDHELDRVRHARQNGVPLVETRDGGPRPGELVNDWRAGNWSGSVSGDLRSLRAGACVQEGPQGRFLVYGYFTGATPSGMARTFLAAGCTHAIHLDMNALEHTYLAVYDRKPDGGWIVHHLDKGMSVLDKERKGVVLPRFVAMADNRDFFTVLRSERR